MNQPDIDIEYWDYDDGSVGGRVAGAPDGEMWAEDERTLGHGIGFLIEQVSETERAARATGKNPLRTLATMGMQGAWLDDGRYHVRFLPVKGFGVSFSNESGLKAWLSVFVKAAIAVENRESRKRHSRLH
jgi:streptogramin lyase